MSIAAELTAKVIANAWRKNDIDPSWLGLLESSEGLHWKDRIIWIKTGSVKRYVVVWADSGAEEPDIASIELEGRINA